jgi:hypothetical protein
MPLHVDKLRDDTRQVYQDLRGDPAMEKYLLIGGTALALHYAHRLSEDLDFAFAEPRSSNPQIVDLDKRDVAGIVERLKAKGYDCTLDFDQADIDDALNDGADLLYSQQDWKVGQVKVSFITPNTAADGELLRKATRVADGSLRIASSDALFEIKSRLLVERATQRDLYDIWFFLERQDRTLDEVFALALKANPAYTEELLKRRLLPSRPRVVDPGFEPSPGIDAPANFAELMERLTSIVSAYERKVVEEFAAGSLFGKTP